MLTFTGLRNKHLRIAVGYWATFLQWECPGYGFDWVKDCPNERTGYTGMMWELLLFMKHARNITITLDHGDGKWGECYAINNCTGMIGMVNRKEVDFALGNCEK